MGEVLGEEWDGGIAGQACQKNGLYLVKCSVLMLVKPYEMPSLKRYDKICDKGCMPGKALVVMLLFFSVQL